MPRQLGRVEIMITLIELLNNPMDKDLPEIHLLFKETRKGFDPISNKFIKLDFEHVLEGKVISKIKGSRVIKKLEGCHYDLLGYLEENNIITLHDKASVNLEHIKQGQWAIKLLNAFSLNTGCEKKLFVISMKHMMIFYYQV